MSDIQDAIASDPISYNFQNEEIRGMVSGLAKEKLQPSKSVSNVKEFILSVDDDDTSVDSEDDRSDDDYEQESYVDDDRAGNESDDDNGPGGNNSDNGQSDADNDKEDDNDDDNEPEDDTSSSSSSVDNQETVVRLRDECVNMQVKLYGKVLGVPGTDDPTSIRKSHKYYSSMMAKKYAVTRFQRMLTLLSQGAEMGGSYTGLADLDGLAEVVTETNKDPEVMEAMEELVDKYPLIGKGSTPETRLATAYGSAIAMFLFTKKVLKDDPSKKKSEPPVLKQSTISDARMQKAREMYKASAKA